MPKIFPLGLDALVVEFGNEISETLNLRALGLAEFLENNRFEGFIETFPAYTTTTCFYDFYKVKQAFPQFPTAFNAVKFIIESALNHLSEEFKPKTRIIKIPVNFNNQFAPDLEFVAEINQLQPREVIEIFTAQTFRVYMVGFLPGFAYMGKVDDRINAPRKSSPRLEVPKGSVGIAENQTGIYPFDSPGGWQIIGRTNIEMFDVNSNNPCYLEAGDLVKFYEHSF